jgi:hypothetical protein
MVEKKFQGNTISGSTGLDHSITEPEIKGFKSIAVTHKCKMEVKKVSLTMASCLSTMVDHLAADPEIEGSNPALLGNCRRALT